MDDSFDVKLSTETEVVIRELSSASVTWKIPFFEITREAYTGDVYIISPGFQCSGATWELKLDTHGTRQSTDNVSISLIKSVHDYWPSNHIVSVKFTVPCNRGPDKTCELYKTSIEHSIRPSVVSKPLDLMKREILLDNNSRYLENGVLTIKCDMAVYEAWKEQCKSEIVQNKTDDSNEVDAVSLCDYAIKDDVDTLLTDMEALYMNPRFADVTLKVGTYDFPAHKVVLRSRSKVFNAMFEHDMKENQQGTVNISNVEHDTFKDLLRYIYCGKVRQLSSLEALNLYIAADQYDMQGLVLNCRKVILNELSIDNISEVVATADLHNDQFLIDAVKSFLSKNMKVVLMTEKWKTFSRDNPILSLSLIQSAIINN